MSIKENYPDSLFKTWLDYRTVGLEQSRADVIREVNAKLDRKYLNTHYYKWLKLQNRAPDILMTEILIPELPKIIEWYFKNSSVKVSNLDLIDFSNKFKPPIKNDNES